MKKRILASILCLTLAGTLFSGCNLSKGTDNNNQSQETPTPQAEETPGEEAPAEQVPEEPTATPTPTLAPVTPEAEAKSNEIYVVLPDIDEGASGREAAIIKEAAEGYGYQVVLCEHDGEIEEQTEAFNRAIQNNALGIICDNAGVERTEESVSMAKAAGIPTILINKGIDAQGSAVAQILTDVESGATQVGHAFVEKFGTEGVYVELLGETSNLNAINATDAFHWVVDESGVYPERQEVGSEYDENDAEAKIRSMLSECPDARGIVCYNGMMADAAQDEAEEMGRNDMVIVCLSADDEAEELVREGKVFAAAIKPAQELAQMSIDQMHQYLTTGSTGFDEIQFVEGDVIRGDNAS